MPSLIKSFRTVNYEGTQAKIDQNTNDNEYYNIFPDKKGWWVSDIKTDMQEGKLSEFLNKENKWFNRISGVATAVDNLDTSEFTVQGIGNPNAVPVTSTDSPPDIDGESNQGQNNTFTFTIQEDPS